MPVIGVGKAHREVERAGAASRTRRAPRDTRAALDEDVPAVEEVCRRCGRPDFVMATEEGPTCLACESEPLPAPTEGLWMEALWPLAGWGLVAVAAGWIPVPVDGKRLGVWGVAYGAAVVVTAIGGPTGARMTKSFHAGVRRVGWFVVSSSVLQSMVLLGLPCVSVLREWMR